MTIKLYDTKPYDTCFQGKVVDIIKEGKKTAIILDQTLFFPEEGGQSPDKGIISIQDKSVAIEDVQIRDEIIYHYVKGNVDFIEKGSEITGEIDFSHRFSNMQQHSGEHIFSGLAKRYFECVNVGFHLSDSEVTFDYDKPLSKDEIEFLEKEVNKIICENRKITAFYPDKEELLKLDYRSKKEIETDVRLVEIEGIDLCACCAPHVRRTGEIGICKVVNYINYKGGVRISILCGSRALELFREIHNTTKEISKLLSAKRENLAKEVNRINDSLHDVEYRLVEMEKRNLDLILSQITDTDNHSFMDNNIINDKAVVLKLDGFSNNSLRDAVNKLKEKYPNRLIGTISRTQKGYFFIFGSYEIDCNEIAKILRKKFDAKGGGSSDMIQGNLSYDLSKEDVTKICEDVL